MPGGTCRFCGKPIMQLSENRWAHSDFGYWCSTAEPERTGVAPKDGYGPNGPFYFEAE